MLAVILLALLFVICAFTVAVRREERRLRRQHERDAYIRATLSKIAYGPDERRPGE